MSLQCRKCGAHLPAWASFCHKCGAPVPAERVPDQLVCQHCGKIQPDPWSRFCDRCGMPVTPRVQPLPPAVPAMKTKACPRCGFKNSGSGIFFCKKCGSSLETGESFGYATERRLPEGATQMPASQEEALPYAPEKSVSRTPSVAGYYQEEPPKPVRSYRKIATGIAALILILAIIAGVIFFTNSEGAPSGSPDKESGPDLLGLIPSGNILGIIPENATAPAQLTTIPQKKNAGAGVVSNRAVPVVTDTSLKMK
jgi:uncharacterized membrane protein YvbJ